MPASSEFVALCQAQVALLTQGLGAALTVVYLREELLEEANTKLVPVVVYPETNVWEEQGAGEAEEISTFPVSSLSRLPMSQQISSLWYPLDVAKENWEENSLRRQRQIFLPLIHEGVVMGLLVTGREDRPWDERERLEIEQIASTLAIACIMDKRRAWLEQQLHIQEQLEEQRRDMLDDLLHQFRNPLTALRTFGKLLLKRLIPPDVNREVATSMVRESDRLQELLQEFDKVIDLKKEEQLLLTLKSVPVQLERSNEKSPSPLLLLPDSRLGPDSVNQSYLVAEVLEPLLDSARAIAGERNLDLITKILPSKPVFCSPLALREVLSNLIDNALKYTPPGGKILIEVGESRVIGAVTFQAIAISDTGSGIPQQDLEHLFERHYRGIQAESDIPGSGLGLAIARDLVEQMQGKIEVISPTDLSWAGNISSARGTKFIVWLPVREC